jgi:DNA-binding CsgD family transcriptional regulator
LEALIPHLQQALRIHRRIGSIESERASVIDALDRMPLGFILARANGTVILANRAARDILNLADGLQSVSGRLAAASPTENKVLQHWILTAAQAIDGIAGGCGGALSVSRPSLKTPLSVLITPIRSHASNELNDGRAAIFVADPEQAVTVRSEVLQDLWGLTAAEAVVASRIAAGQTVTEIAASLLVTNGTVRWHLKRVLAKTDTGRQPELVRVLATGPSTVRTAENSHNSRPSAAKR